MERAGHGPFDKMGLICPGILGPATDRTSVGRAPLTAGEGLDQPLDGDGAFGQDEVELAA
jgi:hypothetical protein